MIFFVPKIYFINKKQSQKTLEFDTNQKYDSNITDKQLLELEKSINKIISETIQFFKNITTVNTIDTQLFIIFEYNDKYKFDYEKNIISLPQKDSYENHRKYCVFEILKFCIGHALLERETVKTQSKNYQIALEIITDAIINNSVLKNYEFLCNNSFLRNLIIDKENLLKKWREEFKNCKLEEFVVNVYNYVYSNENIFKLIKLEF